MTAKGDLLAEPSDTTKPYWDAANEGRFVLQQCIECGEHIYYPREWCPHCFSTDLDWAEANGRGTVHTFTVLHQTPVRAYQDDVPYVLAVVKLTEGPQMMANIVNCDPEAVAIGDEVTVTFEQRGERKIPQFEPA